MKFLTNLLEYQKQAVNKLSRVKVGALYMEMGTGKTRTALELAYRRIEKGKADHIIWLCPCDVKESMKNEFERHLGSRNPQGVTICGIQTLSSSIRTYNILERLCKKHKVFLVVDESILVKNFFAQRTKRIVRLSELCKYKLILNGTPVSRNEADLFAQWYILDWRILGYKGYYSFAANHLEYDDTTHRIRRVLNTDYLAAKIEPYTYQCTKDEVLQLKRKLYSTYYFELTDEQIAEYERVKEMYLSVVDEFNETTIYRLLNAMQLVVCGSRITSEPMEPMTSELMFNDIVDNPRYQKLEKIIYKQVNDKAIIYCKYTQEILAISKQLKMVFGEDSTVTFYGGMNVRQREKALEQFKNNARFIIANKMCLGYGKNLQFCDTIIYYSNDWDFATRQQSEDRIYRIGQEKDVQIIDICADNKLDLKILNCLYRKERLLDSFQSELKKLKEEL